jgi:hypothetical protein
MSGPHTPAGLDQGLTACGAGAPRDGMLEQVPRSFFGDIIGDASGGLGDLFSEVVKPVLDGILNEASSLAAPLFNELWTIIYGQLSQPQYFPALTQLLALPTFIQEHFVDKILSAADNIVTQAFNGMYDAVAAIIDAMATTMYIADTALQAADLEARTARAAVEILSDFRDLIVTAGLAFCTDYAGFVNDVLTATAETAEFVANIEAKFGSYIVETVIRDATIYATGRIVEIKQQIVRDINLANDVYTTATAVFEAPQYDAGPLVTSFRTAVNTDPVIQAINTAADGCIGTLQASPIPRGIVQDLSNFVSQVEATLETGQSLARMFRVAVVAIVIAYALYKIIRALRL